ncbi:hypothetical protein [Flavobacterium columnare]|uniref:Phage tail assembly protein n=1 Tax=Flavobacterium columnare TaxID=996 RepID=A0AAI8CDV9_9FLAO|nr:hypothetical protein [Flavobacterium columnare]AMO19226.1 hypothetical protein UN65_01620 [Flavobacterium columnare]AUX17159.1 hypothetical protein AQ623_01675 [Flavobacterium columnare]QOG56177.1 hypothetical protein HUE29_01635 [Flavobacterium columnare]QOG58900.1 hypothetical protein HUE30_01635 [Flavobacterium columnare]QOG61622.1 hypothetical protein HUE31_01640 [Flavobacterium columnare]
MAKEVKKLSEDQIKAAGGAEMLRRVELPLDDNSDEVLEVVVCVPDRRTMGQYLKYQNANPAKAQEILVKNCLLTDRDQVLADDALFLTCVSALAEIIPIRENRIKKY